ncbi:unnamed protein product [Symbiodinium sp. CCMP2592]|nr:unnamed protein product [Symbiodinium sp. CCMP2592]
MKPAPPLAAELMLGELEVSCGCRSELAATHAGYLTAKEQQIVHVVPEGAPKEDYEPPSRPSTKHPMWLRDPFRTRATLSPLLNEAMACRFPEPSRHRAHTPLVVVELKLWEVELAIHAGYHTEKQILHCLPEGAPKEDYEFSMFGSTITVLDRSDSMSFSWTIPAQGTYAAFAQAAVGGSQLPMLERVGDTCRISHMEGGQITQGVPAGAAKEDYELSMFVVAKLASFLQCFLMYDPFLLQGHVKPTPPLAAALVTCHVKVSCGCRSELASQRRMIIRSCMVHGVPEGAPKEDYELSMFVAAMLAFILPYFLICDPFWQPGLLATTQLGIHVAPGYHTWKEDRSRKVFQQELRRVAWPPQTGIPCSSGTLGSAATIPGRSDSMSRFMGGASTIHPMLRRESKAAVYRQEMRDCFEIGIEHGFLDSPDQAVVAMDCLYMHPARSFS